MWKFLKWLSKRDESLAVVLLTLALVASLVVIISFIRHSPGGAAFAAVTMLALWVHHRWVEYKQEQAKDEERK